MAEKLPSQTRKPQKIRVCTVCKEHVKDKMYRSLVSEPSEPYRKYITEIGIPATGHLCYPCVSKLNRLVKIDRDLSTLLDKLKQKRVHLMCELKMLSTGMDHVDANFTSNILGMTPKLESPPPKKKKDEDEISTAHFSRILPKKQPVLVIQNPVPKLPQTVALGNAPVIVQAVQGPDSGCVPRTGKAKTQQVSHLPLQPTRPGVGLVSLLGKQKTRPVTHSPTQPSKPGVSSVLHTGKPDTRQVSHQPLQPITSMIRELPKILPRPFQATFDSGSSESGSGENGVSLPSTAVSNVIVQTGVPVSFHMSTVPSGAIVDPGTQGAETAVRGALVARLVHGGCSDVVKVLSTDDQSDQQGLPLIKNEPGDHSFENMNSSQEYNMREEVCLKNGFERIVTESGDEYSIVKQEFSDSESSDTDVPMFGIESSGGTDGDKSFPQSIVVKPEPQAGLHMLDEHVSTHNVASHQEHVKHGSVTSDSGMSISQSVTIKQEPNSSFDTPEEHVPVGCLDNCEKHGSVTSDSGVSISQSVVIKQEPHSDFDPPKGHISAGDLDNCNERVKCDSDEVDTDLSSSQCDVSIKKEPPDHTDTLKNVTCADNVADIFPESVSEHFVKYEVT
ncbi:uncharacterized protein LOC124133316 [Haliotis rufescens]|uniref:uncharacterized protein LOC124133316 n=1 Tax=Haliotis rufescens TaxID=6454 RepID=UPI00201FB03C|nr:uncharacterized protein LOC124133316 [Haliotis rufescens]